MVYTVITPLIHGALNVFVTLFQNVAVSSLSYFLKLGE